TRAAAACPSETQERPSAPCPLDRRSRRARRTLNGGPLARRLFAALRRRAGLEKGRATAPDARGLRPGWHRARRRFPRLAAHPCLDLGHARVADGGHRPPPRPFPPPPVRAPLGASGAELSR